MANILEFLRGVLTDGDAQRSFQDDPHGLLERSGFGGLTGEDVVEGVAVLRRSLPDDLADALSAFEDEDDLPAIRPATDESELDAAVRVIAFAVGQVPASADVEGDEAEQAAPAAEPESGSGHEAQPTEPEAVVASVPATEPIAADVQALPSVRAFTESLAAVASDARTRSEAALQSLVVTAEQQAATTQAAFEEALRQVVVDAEAAARDTAAAFEELLRQAEADANAIRAEAEADRRAAREYLERTRSESDDILERARQRSDDLRQEADDVVVQARAEADAARAEIDARRAELRDAERQLKERLSGIDSLFRSVLRDDEGVDDGDDGDDESADG